MARTQLSERAKAMATATGWKLRHIQINHPDGTGQLVCQDADGHTLMLNGTWTMDPLQAGGWNYAASVGKNKDPYTYSRKSSVSITAGTPTSSSYVGDWEELALTLPGYMGTIAASSSRNTTVIISLFRQSTLLPLCRHLRRTKISHCSLCRHLRRTKMC